MKLAALGLLGIGLLQMSGDVLAIPALKAFGAALQLSPAPKVFSAVQGLETYSTRFFLEWTEASGAERSVPLTPQLYARMRGPYQRRNVYGAALAYGPVLTTNPATRPMFEAVARFALCGDAPLLRELGLSTSARAVRIRLEPRPGADLGPLPRVLHVPCR